VSRIIVVEDDPSFRRLVVRVLGSWGHEVAGEAATAAEALVRARDVAPDVVLVDIGLPDMDGFALTRELLALPAAPRVVLISTDADPANHQAARRAGAEAFVPKDQLVSAVLRSLVSDPPP
jgi:CheY-like chemotaxis protein